jgi:hypothetical protein
VDGNMVLLDFLVTGAVVVRRGKREEVEEKSTFVPLSSYETKNNNLKILMVKPCFRPHLSPTTEQQLIRQKCLLTNHFLVIPLF